MKKVVAIFLVVAFMFGFVRFSPAIAASQVVIKMTIGNPKAYVDSKVVTLDSPPIIENGRTLVPFRFIGESIGANIGWDGTKKEVSYVFGDINLKLTIGSNKAVVNNVINMLDVPPKIVSGRTLVPVRFVTETLGAKVGWDANTRTVTITASTTPPKITFKPKAEYTMQVNVGPAFDWGKGAQKWADLVKERTNGLINIKPYFGSSLLQGKQTNWFQAVSEGSIDFVMDSTINASGVVQSLNLFSLPFFINTYENVDKIENGTAGKIIIDQMEKLGVVHLAWGENGFRQLTNSKRPIKTPEDMRGLKFRVVGSPIFVDIFKTLGADAVSMNWGDAVTAFQQGAVDGQENPYGVLIPVQIWQYHKYLTNWNYVIDPLILGVSKQTWDKFPPYVQKAIKDSALEAAEWEKAMVRRGLDGFISINILKNKFGDTPNILDMVGYVRSKGMQIIDLTPEERQQFINATKSVYDKWIPIIGKDIYNAALKDMGK
ncbi:DctP family TRAP transporter solute-binding subunit [Caldisericum sp. AR60]|uniref:DctP family TRAP transporter solute-binding subunit n=1 Tax=Caldisericum sp. AR60 TaxID=3397852 RepID=UPI0039FCF696